MKRYEKFNKHFSVNETIEEQALAMLLTHLETIYNIDLDGVDATRHFNNYIKWLSEEA